MKNKKMAKLLAAIAFIIVAVGLFFGIQELQRYQQKQAVFTMIDEMFEGMECRNYERMLDHLQWVYQDSPITDELQMIAQTVETAREDQLELVCQKATKMLEEIENSLAE